MRLQIIRKLYDIIFALSVIYILNMPNKEIRPVLYFGAATAGFFAGVCKSYMQNQPVVTAAETIAATHIAAYNVRKTTRPFSYFGYEGSRVAHAMTLVSRGGGIFARTAAVTWLGERVGEQVCNKVLRR